VLKDQRRDHWFTCGTARVRRLRCGHPAGGVAAPVAGPRATDAADAGSRRRLHGSCSPTTPRHRSRIRAPRQCSRKWCWSARPRLVPDRRV